MKGFSGKRARIKRDKKIYISSTFLSVCLHLLPFSAIIIYRPHLLSHPHASLSFSYLFERLCAHHRFKWFSLSTAFLKYLPESETRKKESIMALWNAVCTHFSHHHANPQPRHSKPPTIQQPEVIVRRANERAAQEQQQKEK